jgi:hemerythrin superfamily protein
MSALIEGFKKEHSEIIEAFREVKKLGILTKEGHAKLMSLLPDLLDHLWNEDDRLYPVLRKASEHNKKLEEILSFFENGLGAIHENMLIFMTRYAKGVVIDINFQREYESLSDALSKRIGYEEDILYEEYNKLYQ